MSEESSTPDLVELSRQFEEALNRRDLGSVMSFYAPDAVWDGTPLGLATLEGRAAIREAWEVSVGGFEDISWWAEERTDVGTGIIFTVTLMKGRPTGSTGELEQRFASVTEWTDGLLARVTTYRDIDEARAAAERLAQERG
jgi:ketosteroid isomerase-like protein